MQAWLSELKIAIAEEDIEAIGRLFAKKIQKATKEELIQALSLSKEALDLVKREKDSLANTINKIKTAKKFFKN